jgi:hypothetical protein
MMWCLFFRRLAWAVVMAWFAPCCIDFARCGCLEVQFSTRMQQRIQVLGAFGLEL